MNAIPKLVLLFPILMVIASSFGCKSSIGVSTVKNHARLADSNNAPIEENDEIKKVIEPLAPAPAETTSIESQDQDQPVKIQISAFDFIGLPTAIGPAAVIEWSAAENATSYTLVLSSDDQCSTPVSTFTTSATKQQLGTLATGKYYTCLTAKAADDSFRIATSSGVLVTVFNPIVLGQGNASENRQISLGMTDVAGMHFQGGKFFAVERTGHRVMIWNTFPANANQEPDVVIGQPTVSQVAGGTLTQKSFNHPECVFSDGTRVIVCDTLNHRVMIWNSIPTTSGLPADLVLGQPDFSTSTLGLSATTFNQPSSVTMVGQKLFVVDRANNRVLVWNTFPTENGKTADLVLGQPNFTSSTANNGGLSASTFNRPNSVYSDGTKFFVSDTYNHRVLGWSSIPTMVQQAADISIGQALFNSVSSGTARLSNPTSISGNGAKLVVADSGNRRVLIWNSIPAATSVTADVVVGQPDYATNSIAPLDDKVFGGINGVLLTNDRLVASDSGARRIIVWNTIPTADYMPSSLILGQESPGKGIYRRYLSQDSVTAPVGISSDGIKLVVADSQNNRVLIWNTLPSSFKVPADVVLGQIDFTSNAANVGGITGSTLYVPVDVLFSGTKLFVSDAGNNRVLVWNTIPTVNGTSADFALGQPNLFTGTPNTGGISNATLKSPRGIAAYGDKLIVSDYNNQRILIWNSMPLTSGVGANHVLGQPDFISSTVNNGGISAVSLNTPLGITVGETGKLYIADRGNHRVLVWNTIPTTDRAPADHAIGQPDFVTRNCAQDTPSIADSGFCGPIAVSERNGKVYIVDQWNNRIMIFSIEEFGPTQKALFQLGQSNYDSYAPNPGGRTITTLHDPSGIFVDAQNRLYISDTNNHRVVIFQQ